MLVLWRLACHQRAQLRTARPLIPNSLLEPFTRRRISPTTRKASAGVCILVAWVFYLYNSDAVPETGRRRFNMFSDGFLARLCASDEDRLKSAMGGLVLGERDWRSQAVKRVMARLAPLCGSDEPWHCSVVAGGDTINAAASPGRKITIHAAMVDLCTSDDALATVLAHELAHHRAQHIGERYSIAAVAAVTSSCAFFAAGAVKGLVVFSLWGLMGGYYLRHVLFELPMSRRQETEADYMGLMMMADACYDPRAAVGFWRRLDLLLDEGREVPEMLRTHPTNENRIAKLREWLPVAMDRRSQRGCPSLSWRGFISDGLKRHLPSAQPVPIYDVIRDIRPPHD
ncbi:hypothetical protein CDD80_918 [Ophiocordyceps camponoti-rufipedis]|uniref:Peptidase M48 domain-containing protein n=1 Tax=Ophiocordyceps camponoti-rufipedis TaxID=2004952 RepID=A0A2C5YGH3_9HYPO|nr:hypothetical protein CDD80_918 [Ophiocordyceps camponoti-rufipedis]